MQTFSEWLAAGQPKRISDDEMSKLIAAGTASAKQEQEKREYNSKAARAQRQAVRAFRKSIRAAAKVAPVANTVDHVAERYAAGVQSIGRTRITAVVDGINALVHKGMCEAALAVFNRHAGYFTSTECYWLSVTLCRNLYKPCRLVADLDLLDRRAVEKNIAR